jgi:hypothetical protein
MIDRAKINKAISDSTILAFQRRMVIHNMVAAIVAAAIDTLVEEVEKTYGKNEDEGSPSNEGAKEDGGSKDTNGTRKRKASGL